MGILDKLKKDEKKANTNLIKNAGGCIITRSIYEGKSKLKWIFREESNNALDNGWRVFGDTDDQEYINDPNNLIVVDFNTLANIEPAILSIYNMPVGTELEFFSDSTGRYFIDTKTGERVK